MYLLFLFFLMVAGRILQTLEVHRADFRDGNNRRAISSSSTSLEDRLFAQYWSYAVPRKTFRAYIRQFVREALPALVTKLERDLGKDVSQQCSDCTFFNWFEIWLAYASPNRMRIKAEYRSINDELYRMAELNRLRELPWEVILRNVPAQFWRLVSFHSLDVWLHLAQGNNIRKMTGYTHYSKKMAHIFHSRNDPTFAMIDGGAHALLISLGHERNDCWSLRMLYYGLVGRAPTAAGLRRATPFLQRMIAFAESGADISESTWNMILQMVEDCWDQKSKQLLRYRTLESLTKAATRHFERLEESIDLEKLLAEYEYSTDTEWAAGEARDWNLRAENDGAWFRIVELRTATEVVLEGARMHHCVGSYVDDCLSSGIHIYSLRRRGQRQTKWRSVATIALRDGEVFEMQGVLNADVSPEIRSYVETWAEREGLTICTDGD